MAGWCGVTSVILGVACGGDANSDLPLYELGGFITVQGTGEKISGATVVFTSDTLYRASTKTDADGEYSVAVGTDTPFGQVRASKPGFVDNEASVFFDDSPRRIDLALPRE